ncbi:uncharacterized protein LOC118750258 [Rhagoletis pomonella]|uniref:uncharacterized protein LOC118750258 n=1 Tax=Rhagoletis pomonella TaxID=28610 RepID=UPI00177E0DBA|nr:uncharacterized protein LOC118750258 [Rhagoletis pomonella]
MRMYKNVLISILFLRAYNCKTRWRSLCDRNRREIVEGANPSGSGSSFRKPWKLKDVMSFDSMEAECTTSNVEYLEETEETEEAQIPQRDAAKKRKMDDFFEDVLVRMKTKYDGESTNTSDEDSFFTLLRAKFIRLSAEEVDELQADILVLVSQKIRNK